MISKSITTKKLEKAGYKLDSWGIPGKTSKEYFYCIVSKDSKKYFCKINQKETVFHRLKTEEHFAHKATPKFDFKKIIIQPVIEELSLGKKHSIFIFPFVDEKLFVSTPKNDFKDFSVPDEDLDLFIETVVDFITDVQKTDIVTFNDLYHYRPASIYVNDLVNSMTPSMYRGVEILQTISRLLPRCEEHAPSIWDPQFQNMAWDPKEKKLIIFDFEYAKHGFKHHDISYLWFVTNGTQNKKEIADMLLKKYTSRFSSKRELLEFLIYFRVNALIFSLSFSKFFTEVSLPKKLKGINRVVDELLDTVHEVI